MVLAQQTDEEGWEAIFILVKPIKPNLPLHGVVVAVDGDEVTIESLHGDKKTVTLPEHARGVAHGDVITVFRGNSGKAKGVVRAEEVRNRLKNFLNHAEEDVDEPEEDGEGKGNKHDRAAAHAERIADFLARFSERRTRLLDRVMDRAPERIRERLAQVRDRIHAQRLEHREAIERIRTKLDRIHPEHSHGARSEATDNHRPDNSDRGHPEITDHRPAASADQNPRGDRPPANDCRGRDRGRGQEGCPDPPTR